MGRKSPPTELVDRKSYGIVEVIILYRYGIRQVLLYFYLKSDVPSFAAFPDPCRKN